jgi:hypothetical protein
MTVWRKKGDGLQIWIYETASGRVLQRLSIPESAYLLAFSPDGCYLATADREYLRLWELSTGQMVLEHKAQQRMPSSLYRSFASCLSFAPDGRTLATGRADSTVLIWNLVPSTRPTAVTDLPRYWEDLIDADAAQAYAASWRLTDTPRETVRFLRERLRPVAPLSAEQARPLLADLDSDEFRKRESAAARLRELGDRAARVLREALTMRPTLEMRRRLEDVLMHLDEPPRGEALRG